mmetsp:Transcript_16884/g.19435  ORF Transcript_16884/g.19435 Transcript_16884/m.19435 type:complete len:598 (-) Transcript_16884:3056-4849(-)
MASTNTQSSHITLAILSDSKIFIWNLPNYVPSESIKSKREENVRVFNPYPQENRVPISCLAWNHNQMVIATSSGISTDEFDNIVLLSAQTGQRLDSFQHDESNQKHQNHEHRVAANTINFGGKSRYLCIGDENGAICLWDLKKKIRVRQYFHTGDDDDNSRNIHPCPSQQVSLDPTDTYVMSLSTSTMYLYNLRDGLFTGMLKIPDNEKNSVFTIYSISNLEKNICAIGTNDGSIYIYDITNRNRSSPLLELTQRHSRNVTGLAFSPITSNLLFSCAEDGIVLAHNNSEGTSHEICSLDSSIQSMSLHSNGVTCAVGCESGDIYIYDFRSSTEDAGITTALLTSFRINGYVQSLHFAPPPRQRLTTTTQETLNDNVAMPKNTKTQTRNIADLPIDDKLTRFKTDSKNDDDKKKTISTQQQSLSVSSTSTAPKSYNVTVVNTRLASINSKSHAIKPDSDSSSNTLIGGSKKYECSSRIDTVNNKTRTTPLSPTKERSSVANKYNDIVRPQEQENMQQIRHIHNNMEGVREVVREEVENLQDEIEEQLRNLHIDMINQFHSQSQEIDTTLSKHFVAIEQLTLENQQLREENERLRQDQG